MQPETYGLIGKKLGHSFSQSYFTKKFEALQLDHQYFNFELPTIQEFPELIRTQNPAGLNVTLPYKKEVIPYLDELDPVERALLRLGAFELQERIDVPYRVVINEAVALAKKFGATDSFRYVNGVLDRLAREYRQVEITAEA